MTIQVDTYEIFLMFTLLCQHDAPVSSYLRLAGDILTFYTGCDAHGFARVREKSRFLCVHWGSGAANENRTSAIAHNPSA